MVPSISISPQAAIAATAFDCDEGPMVTPAGTIKRLKAFEILPPPARPGLRLRRLMDAHESGPPAAATPAPSRPSPPPPTSCIDLAGSSVFIVTDPPAPPKMLLV